jgi:hypothetical protein
MIFVLKEGSIGNENPDDNNGMFFEMKANV